MDKQTALELYVLFRQENSLWLANHREHSQQYFTLVAAILAASIAAASQLGQEPLFLALIGLGPLFNWGLCQIAITMCNRSYQAYLEGISIQAKLEQVIGLTEPRNPPTTNQPRFHFAGDEYFLPERWLRARHFATSEDFVQDGIEKGANQIIKTTFLILGTINFIIAIGVWVWTITIFLSAL